MLTDYHFGLRWYLDLPHLLIKFLIARMGGFHDKEHRYFLVVPDRVKNVFSGPIRVGLYNTDEILGFVGFSVFEILKGELENFGIK